MQNKPTPFYKKPPPLLFLSLLSVIIFFQIQKRNKYIKEKREMIEAKEMANSKYVKLIDYIPVYQDSTYKIYISRFGEDTKIVYLKKDSISEVQRKSKFFLHIYPKDKGLLGENEFGNLSYDFKNNVRSFNFDNTNYFISETNLPKIKINKINTGQYAFNGNSEINWSISSIIEAETVRKNLEFNKEKIPEFQ